MTQKKVALITGASSGIGRATAQLFARNEFTVVALGRNENELAELRNEMREAPGTIKTYLADVLEFSQVDRVISETIDQFNSQNKNRTLRLGENPPLHCSSP